MEIKLTAVFRKFPEGYAAFVEELPGANTQGATLDEARQNLREAVAMVLEANRGVAKESSTQIVDVGRDPKGWYCPPSLRRSLRTTPQQPNRK
jgi:predicted RNase H-like HicB family nuclease